MYVMLHMCNVTCGVYIYICGVHTMIYDEYPVCMFCCVCNVTFLKIYTAYQG